MKEAVRKYLSDIARRGGKAGTGKAKLRGNSAYYKTLSALGAKARKRNASKRRKAI
jgi:hypothetical protein